MTLIQLEYIISLDRYRHFVTAADKCFVTQPTLSMQIQKLEDELGVKIFDRSKQPVEPTQIGRKIIDQARNILESSSKIPEMILEEKSLISGELKIGIIPTIAQYLVPLFITQTLQSFPNLQIQIDELLTDQVIKALNDNEIDIGIIATPLNMHGIREIPVFYEPFIVFTSQNSLLSEKKSICPADLSIDDIWLLNEGHCFSSQAINLCRMNARSKFSLFVAAAIAAVISCWLPLLAAETNAAPERIGIYDSRAVAYAHFWSEAHQRKINELAKGAKEARAAGETKRFKELDAALKNEQEQIHLRVFSTAPMDDVLAGTKDRLAEIQKDAGVALLVSKWDSKTLKEHQPAQRVEVTDRLLREFKLNEKQMKVARDIQTKPPLPLDEARKLAREGKL